MTRTVIILLTIMLLASHVRGAEEAKTAPTAAAQQYKELVDEYEQEGGARAFAKRFLELAEEHPQDPAAVDALLWVVKKVRGRSDTTRAIKLLTSNYIDSKELGTACKDVARSRSIAAEKLFRAALEKSPHTEVRAQACFHLALLLDTEANVVDQLKAAPELAPRVLQYYGKDYGKHLSSLDPVALAVQREQAYELMLKSFAKVETQDSTLGKIAEKALFAIRHLSIGRTAPEIAGEDIHGKEFKLSDYRGKVVMLTFWGHW